MSRKVKRSSRSKQLSPEEEASASSEVPVGTNEDPSVMDVHAGEDVTLAVQGSADANEQQQSSAAFDDFPASSPPKKKDRKKRDKKEKRHRSKRSRNEPPAQSFEQADADAQAALNAEGTQENVPDVADTSAFLIGIAEEGAHDGADHTTGEDARPKKKSRKHGKRKSKDAAPRSSTRSGGRIHEDSDEEYEDRQQRETQRSRAVRPTPSSSRTDGKGRKEKIRRSDQETHEKIYQTVREWTKIGIEHQRATWRRVCDQLLSVDEELGNWFKETIPANTIRRWKKSLCSKLQSFGYGHITEPPPTGTFHEVPEEILDRLTETRYTNCGRHKKWPPELTEPVQRKIEENRGARGSKDFTVPQVREAITKAVHEEFGGNPEYLKLAERNNLSDTTLRKIVRDILEKPLRSLQKRASATGGSAHYRRPLLHEGSGSQQGLVDYPSQSTEGIHTSAADPLQQTVDHAAGTTEKSKKKKKQKRKRSREPSTSYFNPSSSSAGDVTMDTLGSAFTSTNDTHEADFAVM